jgi:hypothetical protein
VRLVGRVDLQHRYAADGQECAGQSDRVGAVAVKEVAEYPAKGHGLDDRGAAGERAERP